MEDWELHEINSLDNSEGKDLRKDNSEEGMEEDLRKQDPFTALMFGPLGAQRPHNPDQDMSHQPYPSGQQGINYEEIMVNIDKLIESAKGLKPLFQKIYPFVEQIWKKK